jgi:fermentation-respiration switch protein FrsA (DUF1100 family)
VGCVSVDEPPEVEGCAGVTLFELPDSPAQRGPWPVGVRTVRPGGYVTELWYPAELGSEGRAEAVVYDIRQYLPESDRDKIPDQETPFQHCDCFRDLPVDTARGPYPLVLFIHGTAGFRTQSLSQMQHWASRGFIVAAADHPGLMLSDLLGGNFGPNAAQQAREILTVLREPTAGWSFLEGVLDADRIAVSGHSAGGAALTGFGDLAQLLMPMAAGGSDPGPLLRSVLVLGGEADGVVPFADTRAGYDASPAPKRLVGLARAGHLAFSDICALGAERGGLLQIAQDNGVEVPPLVAELATDGCGPEALPPKQGWEVIDHATSAALEETLHCSDDAADRLATIDQSYGAVGTFLQEL